jgi:uncharacterized membrane protein
VAEQTPPEDALAVVSDEAGAYYLIVAQFAEMENTQAAYDTLVELEKTTSLRIDGVVIASADAEGKIDVAKATDHSTRRGLGWGVVGGIVLGALFPPTILASALTVGGIGALVGKGRNLHHRKEIAEELEGIMAPNTTGIIALVEDTAVVEIEKALAKADKVVSKAVDKEIAAEIDREAQMEKDALKQE